MSGGESLFSSSAGTVAVVALIMALLALGGVVFMLARQQRLLGQYQHLMSGATGGNLEQVLNENIAQIRTSTERVDELGELARHLQEQNVHDLQHVGFLRYNPFHDTGSDQSFAISLADGRGNGVIISSLHARDMTRIYAKPLQAWGSTYSLTDEEKQVIELARKSRA